jgi:hypothetical protein
VTGQESSHGQDARETEAGPALSASVVAALADSGLTEADYARSFWPDGVWSGDACGCADDRCIGFHHDAGSDCGCFPVLLDQALTGPALAPYAPAEQTPDELSADDAAEVVEPGAELGEAGL